MNRRTKIWICAVCAVLALGVTFYPLVSNYLGERYMSIVQSRYTEAVESLDNSQVTAAREAAAEYNTTLLTVTDKPYSREALTQAVESYNALLNIQGDGIMGYVEIPKIDVNLPIYHGTSDVVLEQGTGHLLGSSLPVGGTGTHAVITGHSGLAGQRMFSDLDQLREGDVFYIHTLDDTLAYMVSEINTVLPEDTSKLTVDRDRDSVTLITCTPYGVNTHRLLVRGDRIEYLPPAMVQEFIEEQDTDTGSTWREQYIHGILVGLLLIFLAAVAVTVTWLVMTWRDQQNKPIQRKRGSHASY